jgi:hypothetical protein
MSVFESTEALWEARHRTWKPEQKDTDTVIDGDKTPQSESIFSVVDEFEEAGENEIDVNEALLKAEAIEQSANVDVEGSDGENEQNPMEDEEIGADDGEDMRKEDHNEKAVVLNGQEIQTGAAKSEGR